MKNTALIMLAASAFIMSSCLNSGVSKSDYTLSGNFEVYAYSDEVISKNFTDSIRYAKQIMTDEVSCLNAVYENSIFSGGFCLSIKKDSLNTEKTAISDFSSAGPGAGYMNSKAYAVYKQDVRPEYDWQIYISNYDVGTCSMSGFAIDNVSTTIKAIEDNPLRKDDFLRVKVTGYLNKVEG